MKRKRVEQAMPQRLGYNLRQRLKTEKKEEEIEEEVSVEESDESSETTRKLSPKHEERSDDDTSDSDDELSPTKTPQLSEYEKLRLENIKRNEEMMRFLDFDKVANDMKALNNANKRVHQPKLKLKVDLTPTRRSLRISGQGAEYSLQTKFFAPEYFKEGQATFTRSHRYERKSSAPINFEPLNEIDVKDNETFLKNMADVEHDESQIFQQDQTAVDDVEQFSAKMLKLRVLAGDVSKVTPSRVYSMAFHPTSAKPILCVGDKKGHIAFWDLERREKNNGIYIYDPHSSAVTKIYFHEENDKLYSSSYDGTVRRADFNTSVFEQVYETEHERIGVTGLSFPCASRDTMVLSLQDGRIVIVDTRQNKQAEDKCYDCHMRSKMKHVDCSPVNTNLFSTSSTDGFVALWDLRYLKNEKSYLDSVNFARSVSAAYFSPISGSQLLTTSLSNDVGVLDVEKDRKLIKSRMFKHNNHTGRWLTPMKASWDPKNDCGIVVGSVNPVRRVDVYHSKQKSSLSPLLHLCHANHDTITSINVLHPRRNIMACGNSSGKVVLWTEKHSR